jgi:membrane protease YdiL (CAAX protease family)
LANAGPYEDALAGFTADSFGDTADAIEALNASSDPRTGAVFEALKDQRLLYSADAKRVFIKDKSDRLTDGASGATVATPPADIEKVRLNNRVRGMLDAALGSLTLMAKEPGRRFDAAQAVFKSRDANAWPALEGALASETDPRVKRVMQEAKAARDIFVAGGFETYAVCCKAGSIAKEKIGLRDDEKVRPGQYEAMCSPVGQAALLAKAGTQLNVVIGLLVVPFLFLINSAVNLLFRVYFPRYYIERNPLTESIGSPQQLLLFVFSALIAGGIKEELQRAFILNRFRRYLGGASVGLVLWSLAFGAGHYVQGAQGITAAALYGLIFGIIYLASGNLIAPIIAHGAYDTLALLGYWFTSGRFK